MTHYTGNRVSLITLGVDDLERSKAYYEAVGFEVTHDMGKAVFYRMGQMMFGLFPSEDLAKEQGSKRAGDLGTGKMTVSQNYPSENAVEQAFQRAIAAGATGLAEPAKMHWGGYSSYVADPDGHVWEYAFNPFWGLDEKGFLK